MNPEMTELREAFEHFRDRCIRLCIHYSNFIHLYESGDGVSALLQESAGIFFDDLHEVLLEYLYLLVGRITDPSKTMGKSNLTSNYFNEELLNHGLMTPSIQQYNDALMRYRNFIVGARNKLIAHTDLEISINRITLGAHNKEEVDLFFDNLQKYNDEVASSLGLSRCDIQFSSGKGDVQDLIGSLRRAVFSVR